jgi:hypothetical protein
MSQILAVVSALFIMAPEIGYYDSDPGHAPSNIVAAPPVKVLREELRFMTCTDKCWYLFPGVAEYDTELPRGVGSLCIDSGRRLALVRDVLLDCDRLPAFGRGECSPGIRRDGGLYTELHRWMGECGP